MILPEYAAIFGAGILAHLTYFKNGEHDRYAPTYIKAGFSTFLALVCAQKFLFSLSWATSLWQSSTLIEVFLGGIYASLLTYRLRFHPLNCFPGPRGARISDLWLTTKLGKCDMHEKTMELYNKYGPFVRIGSSTLMIADPYGVEVLHGTQSKCRKAAMYDFEQPNRGIATRDEGLHAIRRRVWSQAFGERHLRHYETRVSVYVRLLLSTLANSGGKPINAAHLMDYFSFDVMGDLGLSQDFEMLKTDRKHEAIQQLVEGLKIMAYRLPMWLLHLLASLPFVPTEETTGFLGFCYKALHTMMQDDQQGDRPYIMAPLLAHFQKLPPSERDMSVLKNDCRFIIVAGSDTVAATLGFVFYYLARHPEHVAQLRQELLPLMSLNGTFEHQKIRDAPHLNGVISEALRLHPPASTLMRVTPQEGTVINGTFIPGDVTVFTTQYVLGRLEANFDQPNDFVPERWYSRPEMIKNQVGYAPFSTGAYEVTRNLLQEEILAQAN